MIVVVVALLIFLGVYCVLSYPLLRKLGVSENLVVRSSKFGLCIAGIQLGVQGAAASMGYAAMGSFWAVVASFFYVRSVLNVDWRVNILIVLLLPTVAGMLAAPILLVLFRAT